MSRFFDPVFVTLGRLRHGNYEGTCTNSDSDLSPLPNKAKLPYTSFVFFSVEATVNSIPRQFCDRLAVAQPIFGHNPSHTVPVQQNENRLARRAKRCAIVFSPPPFGASHKEQTALFISSIVMSSPSSSSSDQSLFTPVVPPPPPAGVTPTLFNHLKREKEAFRSSFYSFLGCLLLLPDDDEKSSTAASILRGESNILKRVWETAYPKNYLHHDSEFQYKVQIDLCSGTEHVWVEALLDQGGWENENSKLRVKLYTPTMSNPRHHQLQ